MKTLSLKALVSSTIILGGFLIATPNTINAQVKYRAQALNITVAGTSSLHDWEEKASKGTAEAVFTHGANDKITGVTGLNFTLPVKSLKSEHTMMDNNTYKALEADKNPNISFVLTSATVTPVDAATYQIKAVGKLTIAGTTKETDLVATGKYNAGDRTVAVSGTKKFKMSDYNVKPPTAMFGTIKTGDALTISYNLTLAK